MSGQHYVTLSSVIILTKGLESMPKDLNSETSFELTRTMTSKMLNSIINRLGAIETSNSLLISTFLDPKFKNIGFLSESVAERAKKLVINIVSQKIERDTETTSRQAETTVDLAINEASTELAAKKIKLSIWSHFEEKKSGCISASVYIFLKGYC
ncbi:unnamed protein product [Psylliodes chrysocephalus]|uniref:Uncharacterized protein n=1 Tax=Psylliodes chrysocephalus TaxID=3402493 RepID=A0A9P0CW90_9CUCU|nr:unnamed protein product [Psylliodes chrysocephala]